MHVLVLPEHVCIVCAQVYYTPASMCTIHLLADVYNTCAQVYSTPARRCYRHLLAGVTVTNLYILVKHAVGTAR